MQVSSSNGYRPELVLKDSRLDIEGLRLKKIEHLSLPILADFFAGFQYPISHAVAVEEKLMIQLYLKPTVSICMAIFAYIRPMTPCTHCGCLLPLICHTAETWPRLLAPTPPPLPLRRGRKPPQKSR